MRFYLFVLLSWFSAENLLAQSIVFKDSVIRGGSLRQGEVRRVSFTVHNPNEVATYIVVEPGNENIAMDTYRFAIPAGITRTIYMRFRAPAKPGILEIPVMINQFPVSADSQTSHKTLFLRALVSSESNIFPSNKTKVKFDKMAHDFGTVAQGKETKCSFTIKNTDTFPLMVQSVKTNCGCLTSKYSFQPIAPGESAEIILIFNSENRHGRFNNGANITFQTGWNFFVSLTGNVETQEEISAFR
jgi:hypothetical protein